MPYGADGDDIGCALDGFVGGVAGGVEVGEYEYGGATCDSAIGGGFWAVDGLRCGQQLGDVEGVHRFFSVIFERDFCRVAAELLGQTADEQLSRRERQHRKLNQR